MSAQIIPIRRTGMHYFRRQQILECAGCLEHVPVYRSQADDPEEFARIKEMAEAEHRKCWSFRTVEEAQRARREKRRKVRRERETAALMRMYGF